MTPQASATGLVKQAPDGGINFFDTAGVCSRGQSEAVLGAALKELGVDRESVVIAAGGRYADVRADPDAALTPGVVVYRFNGRLFFANAHFFKRRVWAAVDGAPKPVRHLVLDASGLSGIDASSVDALTEVHAGCVTRNITLDIARAKADLRDRLDETGLTALIGPEHFHPTVQDAVDWVREGQLP